MSSVFSLKSDSQFITPSSNGENILVYSYNGDTNDFNIIRSSFSSSTAGDSWSAAGVCVGPTAKHYKALELFGTTIEGDKLKKLVNELKAIEEVSICILVNRLGLCVITELEHPSIKCMRINDYFGWSQYGVEVPRDFVRTSTMWNNRFDMSSGETMMEVAGVLVGGGSAAEEGGEEMRRRLEEKSVELKACKEELERMEKMGAATVIIIVIAITVLTIVKTSKFIFPKS